MNYATPITRSVSGLTYVAAYDSSILGAGWGLSNIDGLRAVGADTVNGYPAGVIRGYGIGGWTFYEQGATTATFNSPAGDNGTLTFNGTNYYYTTPGGDTTTFDSNGEETNWTSADGHEHLNYTWSSGELVSETAIDGSSSSFSYSGGLLDHITAPNGRDTSFTYSGSNLTAITDPDGHSESFTYSGALLTDDVFGNTENQWHYAADGTADTITVGIGSDITVLTPSADRGLTALVANGYPAGVLRAYGSGGWDFYAQGASTARLVRKCAPRSSGSQFWTSAAFCDSQVSHGDWPSDAVRTCRRAIGADRPERKW